ncbi:MAG: TlpA disulfide reductase family protein [Gemmatimonadaceae bacterium]|nr:TlpA disulfide reductase family protein [Gemmatimonadaceae bacterium]
MRACAGRCRAVAAFVLIFAMPGAVGAQRPAIPNDTLPRADLSWSMRTLDGERLTLERFRGRVILINSWATWCEPCVAELSSMQVLRDAIADASLVFALVTPQRKEPVAEFVRRRALRLPVYLEMSQAPAVYRFDAVPTTWIVDREGRIVFRHRGAMRWDTPAVQRFVRSLLSADEPR